MMHDGHVDDCFSEGIHELESEVAENLNHWTYLFLTGNCAKEKLEEMFERAVNDMEVIPAPWE